MDVVVLVSGRGGNLRAIVRAIDDGACRARVVAVISDREDAPALDFARERAIATRVVPARDYADRSAWDRELADAIASYQPGLVVLAGFMRIVGAPVLTRFAGRIVNVHPALLPAFPGIDAPAQAVAARVTLSGCTVHVVDAGVDTGPILAQAAVPVLPDDDAATLHARIQEVEHQLLPRVVHAVAVGDYDLGSPPRYLRTSDADTSALVWPPVLLPFAR
jgi:phosphoribosylglycinamide formyltransferase-1